MRPNAILLAVISSSLLLNACTSVTNGFTNSSDIVVLGRDTYAVNSKSLSLFQGKNNAAADGALKAESYCNQQGRHMEVTSSEASPPVTGVTVSKTLLIFTCVN